MFKMPERKVGWETPCVKLNCEIFRPFLENLEFSKTEARKSIDHYCPTYFLSSALLLWVVCDRVVCFLSF